MPTALLKAMWAYLVKLKSRHLEDSVLYFRGSEFDLQRTHSYTIILRMVLCDTDSVEALTACD